MRKSVLTEIILEDGSRSQIFEVFDDSGQTMGFVYDLRLVDILRDGDRRIGG